MNNTTGYYCSGNGGVIYIPASQIIAQWNSNPTYARAWATQMMAHEYGHHVQFLTGILNASWTRQNAFSTNAARLEESRRRELQASCLGAAYIGANKLYYPMSGGLLRCSSTTWSATWATSRAASVTTARRRTTVLVDCRLQREAHLHVAGNCNTLNATSAYVA